MADASLNSLNPPELSYGQLRMWLIHELEPSSCAYTLSWAVRLTGTLDLDALQLAVHTLVRRHDVLRTAIASVKGQPTGYLLSPEYCLLRFPLGRAPVCNERAVEAAQQFVREPFDLTKGPLRTALYALSDRDYLFACAVHHIACDGYSLQEIQSELIRDYAIALTGEPALRSHCARQYADFARWQRRAVETGELHHQLAFWTAQLSPLPPQIRLCADWDGSKSQGRVAVSTLSVSSALGLRRLGAERGATPLIVLIAAYLAWIHRLTGEEDLSVGTPVSNRLGREFREAVGYMSNTVVIRVRVARNPRFEDFLGRVRAACLDAFEHSDVPFEQVIAAVGATGQLLPGAMLTWTEIPSGQSGLAELGIEPVRLEPADVKFDVSIDAWRQGDAVSVSLQLRHQATKEHMARRLCDRFMTFLDDIAERPSAPLSALTVLDKSERAVVMAHWNRTGRGEATLPIASRIARQAALSPRSPAVVCPALELDYASLLSWSGVLQHQLMRADVKAGDIVPLLANAGPAAVAGMLAVLRAGAVLALLDPTWPRARLERLLQRFGAPTVLIESEAAHRLAWLPGIVVDAPCGEDELEPAEADPNDAAYLILTSGSTGEPKGVVCSHRGLMNRFDWMDREIGPVAGARVLQTTTPVFDSALWQCLWPLTYGGTVVVPSSHDLSEGARLARAIRSQRITLIDFVPSIMRHHLPELERDAAALTGLHTVIFGGERLDSATAAAARALLPRARLLNLYGPTEATIGCIWHEIEATVTDNGPIPIGLPIDNVQAVILDPVGQPCGVDQAGELHLGGACLAQGYFGDPAATTERFIDNPFPELNSERLYRTGDRACRRSDGRILYLGRLDEELKIRGIRINPAEIELVLLSLEGVRAAAVVAASLHSLVAYVVLDARLITTEKAHRALRKRLPVQMTPAQVIALESLPTTAAGKVDRKALATRELPPGPQVDMTRVATGCTDIVAGLMASVLQITDIAADSSFFLLGGHSLLALKLIAWIDEVFGVALPLATLFDYPTPAGIAHALETEEPLESIDPGMETNTWPLTAAQRHMWTVERVLPANTFYLHGRSWRMKGRIEVASLSSALQQLMGRHPLLRARVVMTASTPSLQIEQTTEPPLRVVDVPGNPDTVLNNELARAFDLATAPLFRVVLVRGTNDENRLGICVHHMIADAWSMDVLGRDLASAYRKALHDPSAQPVMADLAALHYARRQHAWLTGASATREISYWRGQLRAPPAPLPRYTAGVSGMRFSVGRVRHDLEAAQVSRLRAAVSAQGHTLHTAILAGVCMLLGTLTASTSIRLGTAVSQRGRAELDAAFGLFTNTVAVTVTIPESRDMAATLAACRHGMLSAYRHAAAPFEWLMEQLLSGPEPIPFPFHTMLFFQQPLAAREEFSALEIEAAGADRFEEFAISGSDLDLIITVLQQEQLTFVLEYKTHRFARSSAVRWLAQVIEHLIAIAHSYTVLPRELQHGGLAQIR